VVRQRILWLAAICAAICEAVWSCCCACLRWLVGSRVAAQLADLLFYHVLGVCGHVCIDYRLGRRALVKPIHLHNSLLNITCT
jgi:hypothetical protein